MSNKGWECPKCNKVYAPWKAECDHCNHEIQKAEVIPIAPYEPMTIPSIPQNPKPWGPPYKLTDWPPLCKTTCGSNQAKSRDDIEYEVYS